MTDPKAIEPSYAAAMPAPQGGALPTGLEWQALERMANTLADSALIPYRLRGKPADVGVILLAAREYGVPPLMALSKLPVVNGTPAPMGELMVALILRAGHYIAADFRRPDGEVYRGGPIGPEHYGECRYRRRDWPDGKEESLSFSIDEAITAGLIDRIEAGRPIARTVKNKNGRDVEEVGPWEQYTPNMARWRAVANVGRLAFADVLLGLSYLPEELGATVDQDGAPIDGEFDGQRGGASTRTAAPAQTIEQRTAQDSTQRLEAYSGDPAFLLKLVEHAETNDYADELVIYRGERVTFRAAVALHDQWLAGNVVDQAPAATDLGTVDAVVIDDQPAAPSTEADERAAGVEQDAPVVEPSAPPADEQAPTRAEPPEPFPASEGDPFTAEAPAPTTTGPATREELARQLARDTLEATTSEQLRALYLGAGPLKGVDVLDVITDDDRAVLDLPEAMDRFLLGNLLMSVAKYIDRHRVAVRADPTREG